MAPKDRTIRVGLIVGLIAFASVAAFYAVFDLLAARGAMYTVDLLGKSVFQGLRDPSVLGLPIALDWGAIVSYSVLHLVISLAIGLVVTWMVSYSEEHPGRSRWVFLVLVAGFVVTVIAVALLTTEIRLLLPTWSIVLANVCAVVLAGIYLTRALPGIWGRLNPFGN